MPGVRLVKAPRYKVWHLVSLDYDGTFGRTAWCGSSLYNRKLTESGDELVQPQTICQRCRSIAEAIYTRAFPGHGLFDVTSSDELEGIRRLGL